VPWGETCILGTTDVDHLGDPDEVHATSDEVESLLDSVNRTFPGANLTQGDILSTFAGLRPLINQGGKTAYQLSREYEIMDSTSGLISITGGKLTTFGRMAQDLVERVFAELRAGFGKRRGRTKSADHVPLTDVSFDPELELTKLAKRYAEFDPSVLRHVVFTYGADAALVLRSTETDGQLARRIVPDLPYIWAEIPYVIKHEMAMTLSDLLKRRTRIIHEDPEQGLGCAAEVAQAMAPCLGWDSAEIERQVEAYRREVALSRAYLEEMQPKSPPSDRWEKCAEGRAKRNFATADAGAAPGQD
jgi:glycerol-3-phosphate dehydrogenase